MCSTLEDNNILRVLEDEYFLADKKALSRITIDTSVKLLICTFIMTLLGDEGVRWVVSRD